jgi:hypothetical protein
VIEGRERVRWRRLLVAALRDVAEGCHSILELRYKHRVERAHGLPGGVRRQRRQRRRDDVTYPGQRLMVELDGRVAHPAERACRGAVTTYSLLEAGRRDSLYQVLLAGDEEPDHRGERHERHREHRPPLALALGVHELP